MTGRAPALLLLSPGILRWTDADFGLPHLVSLGGYVRHHTGVRVELVDVNYEGGDHRDLSRTLAALAPFVAIGVSCYSSFDALRVRTLARFLRSVFPGVPLVTGGYHASACPDELLADGTFDAVVVGEGERPLRRIVEGLLAGTPLVPGIHGPEVVDRLDELPPMAWELLARYWPRARSIGRKLQIYLSRGCPFHCTFCMERAKPGYRWRAYEPERALDELARLATFTPLESWIVNVADPLFGYDREWRRAVLEGVVRRGLVPRQFWTLTRAEGLEDEDVALLARARFAIGVGLESGSPRMLRWMRKTTDPERHLAAVTSLAERSRAHGLTWATNLVVGHPGETPETLRETHAFVERLFTAAPETRGWLSVDPFRLYPGSQVHAEMGHWEAEHGTRFHAPRWWTSLADASFRAQHVDPSRALDFAGRVRFQSAAYAPLVKVVQARFRGQGREVDGVFRRSVDEQVRLLEPSAAEALVAHAARAASAPVAESPDVLTRPFGLHVRDPRLRRREAAVRRLIEDGVLRSPALVDALLAVPPERFLRDDEVEALLTDVAPPAGLEGPPARWLGLGVYARALEALAPDEGDTAIDLLAASGYVAGLLAAVVGPSGRVVAVHPGGLFARRRLARALGGATVCPTAPAAGPFDVLWLGAALPRFPAALRALLRDPGGRAATFLGPRFRPQDLVLLTRHGDEVDERILARARVPILVGPHGWVVEEGS